MAPPTLQTRKDPWARLDAWRYDPRVRCFLLWFLKFIFDFHFSFFVQSIANVNSFLSRPTFELWCLDSGGALAFSPLPHSLNLLWSVLKQTRRLLELDPSTIELGVSISNSSLL
jgi:hypothetical protein